MSYIQLNKSSNLEDLDKFISDKIFLVDSSALIEWRIVQREKSSNKKLNAINKLIDEFFKFCRQKHCKLIRNVIVQQELTFYLQKTVLKEALEFEISEKNKWLLFGEKLQISDKKIKFLADKKPALLKKAFQNISKELEQFDEVSSYQSSVEWTKRPEWAVAELLIEKYFLCSSDAMIANFVDCSKDIAGIITLDGDFTRFGQAQKRKTIIHLTDK